ncbi:fumarylacetoacetate hydrolase family protein [Moraxella bovis]|uniref:2-keto-4-pentenoate hydratase/2-oxohepta-3-ene-1,7-dioic acid hydratase (Catechol pathway) n=1 Tax=Moraxella bovis TaxID=476 RepID=A0A378PYE5_MORBO|nr:fumarylacetoacetate hydrolase family protein [Moraxella bovis]STY93492.1 2-keto-4-pentenoate hydratase/2-oxohepta-3-ene-1,7-dioic acid hydratase (catechol pathway) [Moraxella bovis]
MTTVFINKQAHPINTIYCVGRSYVEHIHELNNEIPAEPLVFLKPNSSITTGDTLTLPDFSENIHHETELVLLIGENKQIIAYTVGLDLTARDVQDVCKAKGLPWLKAKGFKGACWLGGFKPFRERHYHLSLAVNGEIRQDDSTEKMMYSFDYLVDYLDNLYGIQAGDIIMTGSPKGVGKIERGDKLVVKIDDDRYHLNIQ